MENTLSFAFLVPEKILQVGLTPEPHLVPIFSIGSINGVVATVTLSRKSAMEKVGGWHFALSTRDNLTWEEAASHGLCGEHLSILWRLIERKALKALLPGLSKEEIALIECQTKTNSQKTAQRRDIHGHVLAALPEVWANNDTLQITHPVEMGKPRAPK